MNEPKITLIITTGQRPTLPYTANPPLEQYRHVLSDKPLRRPNRTRPLPPEL